MGSIYTRKGSQLVSFEDAANDLLNDYKVNSRKTHDHAKRRIELHLKPTFKG